MKAFDVLEKASSHMKERESTYDSPGGERSIPKTVAMFKELTGIEMTEEQGWLFMCCLKMVRMQQGNFRADNYEDLAAYAALACESASEERKQGIESERFGFVRTDQIQRYPSDGNDFLDNNQKHETKNDDCYLVAEPSCKKHPKAKCFYDEKKDVICEECKKEGVGGRRIVKKVKGLCIKHPNIKCLVSQDGTWFCSMCQIDKEDREAEKLKKASLGKKENTSSEDLHPPTDGTWPKSMVATTNDGCPKHPDSPFIFGDNGNLECLSCRVEKLKP